MERGEGASGDGVVGRWL